MKCTEEGCTAWTEVLESRKSGDTIRRRRRCANEHSFTTYEVIADDYVRLHPPPPGRNMLGQYSKEP